MGSATTQALTSARAQLAAAKSVKLATAEQLFEVAVVVGDSSALLSALTAFETDGAPKKALVKKLFGSVDSNVQSLVEGLVASRWSEPQDLLAALEELGIRAAAASEKASIDEELLAFSRVVSSDHDLELAIGSKLSPTDAKVAAVRQLLTKKASAGTVIVVTHLVRQPLGRRIGELLGHAAQVAADENGYVLAHVVSAAPLAAAQYERLQSTLASRAGREVRLNVVVDPSILGGLKVQIGDDVIDGSIAARLSDVRLKLVG